MPRWAAMSCEMGSPALTDFVLGGQKMLSYARAIVGQAEKMAEGGASVEQVLEQLRHLPLDDFGEFFIGLPNGEFPALSARLPRMADPQVQRNWTGSDGHTLLKQTLTFTRLVSYNYAGLTGKDLNGAKILDFGCGYGRIIRTMYYYSNPEDIYGCDPWDVPIRICKDDSILANLAISDFVPETLPFDGTFDLAYSFSVFTHLSERATRACLNTLANSVSPSGLLVVTIRPIEYWSLNYFGVTPEKSQQLEEDHRKSGFAFFPHDWKTVGDEVTYGDTSMSLEYLAAIRPDLKIAKIERSLDDPYQILVFLQKR